MKTVVEIGAEVLRDWHNYYYKVSEPDESNMGDVADWARKEYIRELIGVYSCRFCHLWFESVDEICAHLSEKHGTKIVDAPRYSGYCDYTNSYYRDIRCSDSSTSSRKKEEG